MDPWLDNFNATREARLKENRSFLFLGEKLTVKAAVAPEVAFRLHDIHRRVRESIEATRIAKERNEPEPEGVTDQEMLAVIEESILDCLEQDSHEAWRLLRRSDSPQPLTFTEISSLSFYVLGRASGLPTGRPTVSSDGPPSTDTSSTDDLPLPAPIRAV